MSNCRRSVINKSRSNRSFGHRGRGGRVEFLRLQRELRAIIIPVMVLDLVKHEKGMRKSPTRTLGGSASPSSTLHSPGQSLHRFKTTGHSTRSSYTYDDQDLSDLEAEPLTPASTDNLTTIVDHNERATETSEIYHVEARNGDDFSFAKPAPAKEP
ncbi:hypothetical protein F3Y22_tig00111098pilonHSYRG00137 [Hibiscus syriacus]|uniref:Uncharacterized protein n=1 Tax=Hibiscus syriacus TaxID=106335 RepID=A0A6A2Z2W9_HIBSY|nr:hypothetical protein F3Y22_tig00111098pilonHSYRG00137 [Hibiscus syriacus]